MEGDEGIGCVANMVRVRGRGDGGLEVGEWRDGVPRFGRRNVLWFCWVRRFEQLALGVLDL